VPHGVVINPVVVCAYDINVTFLMPSEDRILTRQGPQSPDANPTRQHGTLIAVPKARHDPLT